MLLYFEGNRHTLDLNVRNHSFPGRRASDHGIQGGRRHNEVPSRPNARPVTEGWNLGVIEDASKRDIAVGKRIVGIAYGPPVQVYLDLLQGAGRAKDMADHLRSERLPG